MFDFIWSDQHFGHKNILRYTPRDFDTIGAMDEELIWNFKNTLCVGGFGPRGVMNIERAVVVWVGDVFISSVERFKPLMDELLIMESYNILVTGNHDASPTKMCKLGFDCVVDEMVGVIADRRVRISHYPYKRTKDVAGGLRYQERCPSRVKGEVLLHGHTHSEKKVNGNMINVGVDAWDMKPASMAEIESLVERI